MSMSRLIAAVVRNSDPMPPSPPWLDTAAANSADVAEPIGARMTGTSMPRMSQRDVFSIAPPPLGLELHLAREGTCRGPFRALQNTPQRRANPDAAVEWMERTPRRDCCLIPLERPQGRTI